MPLITLTSDFGDNSHYVAIVKGVIYSLISDVTLIDVTHNINAFDKLHAAYVVKNTMPAFPDGTIHLIAVDPEQNDLNTGIVVKCRNQYLVGANNGVMSLICGEIPYECVQISNEALFQSKYPNSFRAAQSFGPTAAFLASGGTMEEIGEPTELRILHWGEPSYSNNCLRGKIIHIDKFGNAITNIKRDGFMELKQERRFEIFIRNVRLKRIVNTYSDVSKADALAIFGESDNLEIAMREASASELLGLKVHDMITIEFN